MKAKVGVIALFVCDPARSQEMQLLNTCAKLVILPHGAHMTLVDQRVLLGESVEGVLQPPGA